MALGTSFRERARVGLASWRHRMVPTSETPRRARQVCSLVRIHFQFRYLVLWCAAESEFAVQGTQLPQVSTRWAAAIVQPSQLANRARSRRFIVCGWAGGCGRPNNGDHCLRQFNANQSQSIERARSELSRAGWPSFGLAPGAN